MLLDNDIKKLEKIIIETTEHISDLNLMLIDNRFKSEFIDTQVNFLNKLENMLKVAKKFQQLEKL